MRQIHSVSLPYTCGELFQGTLDGFPCLVSCPVTIYNTAQVASGLAQLTLPIKARRALTSLPIDTIPPISLQQQLPAGRGYGTSTADIGGVLFAAAHWAGYPLDALQASRLAVAIEPTDSSLFANLTLFDHRRGEFYEDLGPPPPAIIVILDPGGKIDSEAFNAFDWTASLEKIAHLHRQAFDLLKMGNSQQDLSTLGEAATLSAKAHQEILFNPWLEKALPLARQTGACGVCRAHSGTVLGLLYPKASYDEKPVIAYLRKHLPAQIQLRITELTGGGPIHTNVKTQSEVKSEF